MELHHQQYDTLSTNGVVNGSAVVIGTSDHPVLIHGPVTVSTDIVIKGNVSGQGTLYAGRNVQIVGSIVYQNPPDFRGNNPQTIDNYNAKQDMLGLAASGSVIMGDTSQFGYYPLAFMSRPLPIRAMIPMATTFRRTTPARSILTG